MSEKFYSTNTASLKATTADVRILDAKAIDAEKITLSGRPIVGTVSDIRDGVSNEFDIWPNGVQEDGNGNVIVYPLGYNKVTYQELYTDEIDTYLKTRVYKVIDNVCYGSYDEMLSYFDTKALSDGLRSTPPNEILKITAPFKESAVLTTFDSDLSSLERAGEFFSNCSALTSFKGDLSGLINGTSMFRGSENLQTVETSLPNLETGTSMFNRTPISSFEIEVPKLKIGTRMFQMCYNLASFDVDLSSVTDGVSMFASCQSLESFTSDLSNLENGEGMFSGCSALTTFSADLGSLCDGTSMFLDCKLNPQSVVNILQSLPMSEDNYGLYLGIDCDGTEEDILRFVQECNCETLDELLEEFEAKGWGTSIQFTREASSTFDMRKLNSPKVLPIYAKLKEVVETEEDMDPYYTHTSIDGTKKYILSYFHKSSRDYEGYEQFASIEEAESHFEITPKN